MSIEHENLDTITQTHDESELEKYGVWVKKIPEEKRTAEPGSSQNNADDSDIFLDDIDFDNLPVADISSSEPPEPVIDSDLNDKIEETLDAEEQSVQTVSEDMMNEAAGFENFAADLEEFKMPETKAAEKNAVPSVEEAVSDKDIETITDTATVEIDFDEYMGTSENPEDSLLDEKPLNIDLSFQDNFENITPDFPKEESYSSSSSFEAEDVSDMFTDDAPSSALTEEVSMAEFEQTGSPAPEKGQIPDVTEIPEMAELGEMEEFADSSSSYSFPVDFTARTSTPEEENKVINDPETDKSSSGGSFMESIDISEFGTDIFSAEESSPQQSKSADSETVYDISVRADDDSEEEKSSAAPAENPAIQAMSTALFDKIMDELSLLRKDITDLKTDLGELKHGNSECPDTAEEELLHKNGSGFFSDDEEDETIALSGDELNNILTSADFTSVEPAEQTAYGDEEYNEAGITEDIPADDALETPEMPVLNLQETELSEPALDDISFDVPEEEEETLPNEIAIPVSDDLIVDSANDDFFAEDDTPKDIDDTAVHFLCEDPEKCAPFTDTVPAGDNTSETGEDVLDGIETVEEKSEDIFEDTDIAVAAEDIFSVDGFAEEQAEERTESAETEPESLESESEPLESEPEPVFEAKEEAEDIFNAPETAEETAGIKEEESEQEIPSAFDMDFEEEIEQEDLSQFSPVDDVFNSKQWISDEEAAAALAEEAAEHGTADEIHIEALPEEEPRPLSETEEKSEEKSIGDSTCIPQNMREEIKSVLAYMDQLLENLPEEKIVEFARSEHFPVYKKLFTELGLS